jgi:hypothetical protein
LPIVVAKRPSAVEQSAVPRRKADLVLEGGARSGEQLSIGTGRPSSDVRPLFAQPGLSRVLGIAPGVGRAELNSCTPDTGEKRGPPQANGEGGIRTLVPMVNR